MKKILALLLICSFETFSQIEVIETTPCNQVATTFQKYIVVKKCENTYRFSYRDIEYTHIVEYKSFEFEDIDNALYNLYSAILKGFDNPSKHIILNLPNDVLVLRYTKNMGIVSFQFVHSVDKSELFGRSTYMTRKQVDKLFAKIME